MRTIKQKTEIIDIEGFKKVTVRRMYWRAADTFIKALFDDIAKVYALRPLLENGGKPEENPTDATIMGVPACEMNLIADKLPEILSSAEDLVIQLVTECTDLTAEEFDRLDTLAAATILQVSLEINLDDELKKCFAGMVNAIGGLIPAKRTT
jgi:hypothetical protein